MSNTDTDPQEQNKKVSIDTRKSTDGLAAVLNKKLKIEIEKPERNGFFIFCPGICRNLNAISQ